MFRRLDVVQFNENHKWCGCIGIVEETKHVQNDKGEDDIRVMVGVGMPQQGVAYIYVLESENAIEYIGVSRFETKFKEEE